MHAVWTALAALIFLGTAAAQQQRAIDMRLVEAGFKMRAAVTPQQVEHVRKLPAKRFIPREDAGRRYYLYADPDDCKCVFVGDEVALKTYRDMAAAPPSNLPPPSGGGSHPPIETIIDESIYDLPMGDLFRHPF